MSQSQGQNNTLRTVIFFVVAVPLIIWLIMFADNKNKQSKVKARQCEEQCTAKGYQGYDFQWQMLSGPNCSCVGTPEPAAITQ